MSRAILAATAITLVAALGACHEAPRVAVVSGRYGLQVLASPRCPSSGSGSLPVREFNWVVVASQLPGGGTRLRLMPVEDPLAPDTLELLLHVDPDLTGGGTLGGRAPVYGYNARFNASISGGEAGGRAAVVARTSVVEDGRVLTVSGTMNGNINVGLYASASGGECTAADHAWSLLSID